MRKLINFILIALILSFFYTLEAHAATINAASCSQQDVQAAINSAVNGDKVIVPSGNCTWSTHVGVPNNKKIILQGAGMDSTVIRRNSFGLFVHLSQSGSRLTGFDFINGAVKADGDNWRIDNCRFSSDTFRDAIHIRGNRENQHPTGLVDHCVIHNCRILVTGWSGLLAHALWAQPLNLGSGDNVVYVEDCTFTSNLHSNAMDTNYGGRYVFRYNTLNDSYVEAHSVQGTNRATRKWEIYNNTFNQKNKNMWAPIFLRGGTGVVFNNTVTGTWGHAGIALDNIRSCDKVGQGGKCDGTSPWDENEPGEAGYACRDQIGRSTDQWVWTSENPYPPQAHEPAYAWNNKHGNNDVKFYQHNCAESHAHIQPGRDFFNNVQKPGYTPYKYPHPLIQVWDSWDSSLLPPENLEIVEVTK